MLTLSPWTTNVDPTFYKNKKNTTWLDKKKQDVNTNVWHQSKYTWLNLLVSNNIDNHLTVLDYMFVYTISIVMIQKPTYISKWSNNFHTQLAKH